MIRVETGIERLRRTLPGVTKLGSFAQNFPYRPLNPRCPAPALDFPPSRGKA